MRVPLQARVAKDRTREVVEIVADCLVVDEVGEFELSPAAGALHALSPYISQ